MVFLAVFQKKKGKEGQGSAKESVLATWSAPERAQRSAFGCLHFFVHSRAPRPRYFREPLRGPPTHGVPSNNKKLENTVSESTVSNLGNSVSFFGLTEFRGANSVSSFQPIICVQMGTHRVSGRTHRVCRRTQ